MKRSYLGEADGGLLSVVAAEANARDDKLLEATLDVRWHQRGIKEPRLIIEDFVLS